MAKITLEHQDEILTFPVDTILELKVQEVSVETIPLQRGGDWEKAEFRFKILGIQALGDGGDPGPYENWITRDIWGSIPWRLTDSPENKLRIWAEAIFRQELGVGFELDSDMFVQRNVRGLTIQYESGRGQDVFKRHKIGTLLPWGEATKPPEPSTQRWTSPPAQTPNNQQPVPAGQPDPWAPQPGLYGSDEPPF